jgi:alanyl-tRNA synthetase
MKGDDIRRSFVRFFEERSHRVVPSSSLIPNDPTLLLTNAGMNQFKPIFLGLQEPPYPRAVSVQKVFRASDIENVGHTDRHLTFFEMLGNFSFGDYFKREGCAWALELVTEGYGIDPDRLWVTVFETDDETVGIWKDIGIPVDRIVRRGRADNFWGVHGAGPCGPLWTRSDSARSGTSCSWRTPATSTGLWRGICPRRTSIPGAAWSEWPWCCRPSTTRSRPTSSSHCCRWPRS